MQIWRQHKIDHSYSNVLRGENLIRYFSLVLGSNKLNGAHHFLAYVDDVNLLGDNIDTVQKKHGNFN
jgi:hypothetical protein